MKSGDILTYTNATLDHLDQSTLVGTASYCDHHITRVYVDTAHQGRGYGSFLMNCLEQKIACNHDTAILDASLPAVHLYESLGYKAISHERYPVAHGAVLVYEIMEKKLIPFDQHQCFYDQK